MIKLTKETIMDRIKELLNEKYGYLKNEHGVIVFSTYYDYQDLEYLKETFKKYNSREEMFEDDNLMSGIYDSEDSTMESYAEGIFEKLSEEEKDYFENNIYVLVEFIRDYGLAYANFPIDEVLNKIEVNVVMAAKKESSYIEDNMFDYKLTFNSSDQCENYEEFKEELDYMEEETMIKEFIETQDNYEEAINIFHDDMYHNDKKFIYSLYREIQNSYSYNSLVFLTRMTANEYFDLKDSNSRDHEKITIDKSFIIGLVDLANGGGSVLEIELNNSFEWKKENLDIFIDGQKGYSIESIYGIYEFVN